eukprot:TRINITY_DN3342_c0_g1_i8.p1 TRINITY_DN3342_c0_g1~~TRINITY_DN3342_c0_g1_i8.p1  ORF type:complete len:110 (-),score=17.50 TRINITY_DN3342_c0_g1_i8:72-401(-)
MISPGCDGAIGLQRCECGAMPSDALNAFGQLCLHCAAVTAAVMISPGYDRAICLQRCEGTVIPSDVNYTFGQLCLHSAAVAAVVMVSPGCDTTPSASSAFTVLLSPPQS